METKRLRNGFRLAKQKERAEDRQAHLYHLRCSWFSENFGLLSQPFNKHLTVYLATLQALGIQHKNTCPYILAWRSGVGGGR